ncbi:energy transducer TonB [Pontibacter saemangeumensis]|uniref:Energy transducer TonB n=1 Tax=Pontibacter saemangeumensis TaxID=1084525 RepID=A0ABP8LDG0_9BACT
MKKSYYLSMTFNNIIFKGRNQAYGAYALRRIYSKHMALAAILATAIFSGALVGPVVENMLFAKQEKYVKPVYEVYEPIVIELPPLPETPVQPKKEAAPAMVPAEKQVKTEKFVKPNVVEENALVKTETVPDQKLLSKVNIGSNTMAGELPEFPAAGPVDMPAGRSNGTGDVATPPAEFIHAEEMPEFVGGEKALFEYLGKRMRYPKEAQRARVEGIVVVTFVVATDGAITKAEIVKGLGYGTDEEALRVINSMPHWQPGRQNGRAVPVRYTLPIRFNLQ